MAISRTFLIVAISVIVLLASIASYAFVLQNNLNANANKSNSVTSSSADLALITSLAYAHWKAIGEKNLTLIMSQYSLGYRAVWFFIYNSSIGPVNGRYDCNVTSGSNNCNYFLETAWQTFFNHTSSLQYAVCNYTITPGLSGRVIVRAIVWYTLVNMNLTLKVPYEMDFQYYNQTWAVWKDFFGLQQEEASVLQGYVSSSC